MPLKQLLEPLLGRLPTTGSVSDKMRNPVKTCRDCPVPAILSRHNKQLGAGAQHLAAAVLLLSVSVFSGAPACAGRHPLPRVVLGGGVLDANRSSDPDRGAWSFNVAFPDDGGLASFAGLMRDDRDAHAAYGGVYTTHALAGRWLLSASFGPAFYWQGDSKDLGSTLQFRSGLGVFYRLPQRALLGAGVHHLSNGNLFDENPGTEFIAIYLVVPLGAEEATSFSPLSAAGPIKP